MTNIGATQNGWTETTLGEMIDISSGKSRPRNKGEFPVYGGNGILDYANDFNYKDETVIIGRVGAYCGCVYFEKNKFWLSDNALGVKANEKSDIRFLYYFLVKQNLNKKAIGGAQPLLTQGILNGMEVAFPPLLEQRAIATVLSSLDDKTQLLRDQNKTLEETAQAIFKEWFEKYSVDRPEELPEGWRIGKLVDLSEHVKDSTSPCESSNKLFSHYSIPAFDQGEKPEFVKGAEILSNKYIVKDYSFLVSKLNPGTPRIWVIFKADKTSVCSTEFQVIKPKDIKYFSFVYSVLNSVEFLRILASKAHGTSSSHQRVSPKDILEVEIVIPNDLIMQEYQNLVFPVLAKLDQNKSQIQTLSSLRDMLLPKLMQGEIRMKNI